METSEYILIGVGFCISIIGYFLKRESKRLDDFEKLIHEINVKIAKNDVRDTERWAQTEKRMEDRKSDIKHLYDIMYSKK